jgi:mutual gliding-motility protein MglA
VPMRPPSNRGNYGTLPAGSAPTLAAVHARSSPIAPPPSARVEKEKEKEKVAAPAPDKKPVSDQVPTVAPTSSLTPGFSMTQLWGENGERESARRAEQLIAANDSSGAVLACDLLLARMLASAAGLAGSQDAPREPGLVCLLLGLDGRRYLSFRATVRAARSGEEITTRDALECFAFVLEARRARDTVR